MTLYRLMRLGILLAAFLLAGCASEVRQQNITSAPVIHVQPGQALYISIVPGNGVGGGEFTRSVDYMHALLDSGLRSNLPGSQITFGEPPSPPPDGYKVVVTIVNYHYVSPTARVMGGILAGSATLGVRVGVYRLDTGASVEDTIFDTTSSMAHGVFGANTLGQVEAISNNITVMLSGHAASQASVPVQSY